MKKIILISMLSISISAIAQVDTLIKMNGEKLLVSITEVNESSVKFAYPNESFTNSIGVSSVAKIHFKSGRKQEFSSSLNIKSVRSCLDWENVQISNIEAEVKGLSKIDNIGAKAKGFTTLSSLSKLQDRAYNKIKIQTAMLGGNVAYLINNHIEESMYGGEYGSSKLPSVTISGLAYTTKKVFVNEISFDDYKIEYVFELKANSYDIESLPVKPQTMRIKKNDIFSENNFQKINLNINTISKVKEYTIIYANSSEIVLATTYLTRKGKKTYYNVILRK